MIFLGSLYQFLIILEVGGFLLMFKLNFLCFSLCPLPLALSLGTTEKSLAQSLLTSLGIYAHKIT